MPAELRPCGGRVVGTGMSPHAGPAAGADGGVREGGDVAELDRPVRPDSLARWDPGHLAPRSASSRCAALAVRGGRRVPVAGTRLLAFAGDAKVLAACEPKAPRYRLWHVPARLTRSARRRVLRIPQTWPWAGHNRRGLRQHRRDPTTSLTSPVRDDITPWRTAAPQRQPATPCTHERSPTCLTQRRCRHEVHERSG